MFLTGKLRKDLTEHLMEGLKPLVLTYTKKFMHLALDEVEAQGVDAIPSIRARIDNITVNDWDL